MESFGMKDGGQSKKAKATFGLIRRGNASDMEKMKPHFFRVMLEFMLQDSKIYIPTEFVKRYRSRLGSSATLKVANGETWEVELATDDDGLIWLLKGWDDFTKHHSLRQGDIVVFRLEQDSSFCVMVFDPTASEKKYNVKDANDLVRMLKEVKIEEGIDAEKEKGCGEGQERVGTGRMEEVEERLKQVKDKKSDGEENRKGTLASPLEIPNHPLETKVTGIPEPRRGNASTSSKNPNFSITITEGHMKHRYIRLPVIFVFEHMMPKNGTMPKNRTMTVLAEDGSGSWELSFVFHQPCKRGRGRGQGSFAGGWAAFSRDNTLKPGDVCRFELISDGLMKVTIQHN
ncbi:unnamed protein product [Linum tenue]|uniref:TF-B3 domain-containing protein n=1 Tax=Linum tenue TaxID=586396 RepID=A0AAV0L446_9ROSI|nr:unnamed protein product [Linum tenue]